MNGKSLIRDDIKYIWHPFTQMAEWDAPLIIKSANKELLKDINNKTYIDGVSSLWVNVHGHNHPVINKAIIRQLKNISHSTLLGLSNVPSILLAKELIRIAPANLNKVFFSDNGSTSVEVALKMAFQYWKQKRCENKKKFIHLDNSYHGDTIGSVSVGGIDIFHKKFSSLLFKTINVPSYNCFLCKWNREKLSARERFELSSEFFSKRGICRWECVQKVETILKKHHRKIAAFILEPLVQAASGIYTAPYGYLKKIKSLCKKYNVLLIIDEVAVGFGRTGRMFACEHEGISPDFLCFAKGITGGYLPLAVTITSNKVYNAFLGKYEESKTFFHGHTYTGNQLACASALANLRVFKKERTLSKLTAKIKILRSKLMEFVKLSYVVDVRQCGFIAGIEVVNYKIAQKVCMYVRKHGLILRPLGNVIVIFPPLSISERNLRRMLNIIFRVLKDETYN